MLNQSNAGADRGHEPHADPFARTGKERAALVERDYFKKRPPIDRWKSKLAWIGLVLPLPFLGLAYAMGKGERIYSRGPVASVHAAWDDRCDACHESFKAINQNTWASWKGHKESDRLRNENCIGCHAAPIHSHYEKAGSVPNCGGCHRDHRGRDAFLTRLPDSDCTRCHADLAAHMGEPPAGTNVPPKVGLNNKVTNFATDHPQFRRLDKDRKETFFDGTTKRTLKFSHVVHLKAGMAYPTDVKRPPMPYSQLTGSEKLRYWLMDPNNKERSTQLPADNALVQLDCAACHQLDGHDPARTDSTLAAGLPRAEMTPARSAGAYMLPVNFDIHCKACHPLNDFDMKGFLETTEAPHRVQPMKIKDFVAHLFTEDEIRKESEKNGKPKKDGAFNPFERLDSIDAAAAKRISDEVRKRVQAAEKDLFIGGRSCGKCHEYIKGDYNLGIKPISTPLIWFEHSRFDHVAHRSTACTECHKMPPWDKPLEMPPEKETVLIEGIDSCKNCHQPATTKNGHAVGGVRSDCTDCHRYHGGEHTQQGIGSRQRDPKVRMTLDELLRWDGRRKDAPKQ